ncbi:MAG TPA: phosphatidate cytidylyltransferase [Bacillota bacterium]|nr:phosphatidate cytidylyltransferase [Bacillota bacterium]
MNQRVISGVLGGILWFFLVWVGGIYYTLAIGLLITLAMLEYIELLKKQNFRPQIRLLLGISLLLLALIHVILNHPGLEPWNSIYRSERMINLVMIVAFFAAIIHELLRGNPEQGLLNAAVNFFGTVYIGLMFAYILLLRYIPGQNVFYILFTILVTWANDSAAYFIGINFGKHKLCPKISPKKSVEGAIGGLVGGLLVSLGMGIVYRQPLWAMLVLGTVVVVAGQFGDLIESIIKRNAGVKDSGNFLPGHGGVLDRFDSLLLAAPVVYYTITYVLPH